VSISPGLETVLGCDRQTELPQLLRTIKAFQKIWKLFKNAKKTWQE